jgi:hypothetical protein
MKKGEKAMSYLTPTDGTIALLLTAIGIIIIGILCEKKGMDNKSVLANLISIILVWATTSLDVLIYPLLVFYALLGAFVVHKNWDKLYFLFSSKTYGALIFAIAFMQAPESQKIFTQLQSVPEIISPTYVALFYIGALVAFWVEVAVFAYIIGWILKRTEE